MRVALEAGRQPTAGELQRLRDHSARWRRHLDVTIDKRAVTSSEWGR